MKKAILFIFLFLSGALGAKYNSSSIYLLVVPPLNEYDPLIEAITFKESRNGLFLLNEKEQAVGWFQIRQCKVDDYNRLTGSHYKLKDFYDYNLSRKCFLFFAKGKTWEQAAKDWNGSGPMVEIYWDDIKKILNSSKTLI